MEAISKFRPLVKHRYDIPQRYRDAFYLANAALFDCVGWFVHRGYEACYAALAAEHEALSAFGDRPAAALAHLHSTIDMFDQCNSVLDVRYPVRLDSGRREIVRAFRAQHGLFSGFQTCLGGFRMRDDLTRDEMKALAVLSTYKHCCMGVRLSGAHGGIKIDPKRYSDGELKRIVQGYCKELFQKGYCNGSDDILEPDLNTSSREIDWIAETISLDMCKNFVVGKSVQMGGLKNHEVSASQAVFFALDHFLNLNNILTHFDFKASGLKGKTYIIQGLGKLGTSLVKYLDNAGAICVGVKEHDAYLYQRAGINIKLLLEHLAAEGSIVNFEKAKALTDNEIFYKDADILILCAVQKSLICYQSDKIKANIIVEASNGSITPTAHRTLVSRKKLILPDIYACSGYSIASYFEYLLGLKGIKQDISFIRGIYKPLLENFANMSDNRQVVSVEKMNKFKDLNIPADLLAIAIEHVMTETANELIDIAKNYQLDLDLKTAGYIKAIRTLHYSLFDDGNKKN